MDRQLQFPKTTRELPIPIDSFSIDLDVPLLRKRLEAVTNAEVASTIGLWATVNSHYSDDQLIRILECDNLTGIRFNAARYESLNRLAEHVAAIQKYSRQVGKPLEICFDTNGPKPRTAGIGQSDPPGYLDIFTGDEVLLAPEADLRSTDTRVFPATSKLIPISTPIPRQSFGTVILLSDGWLQLQVRGIHGSGMVCEALNDSRMFGGRGVTAPGIYDSSTSLTPQDWHLLKAICAKGLVPDYIALSFTQDTSDVAELQLGLREIGLDCRILAKIETQKGLSNAYQIATSSDGIVIARGDLAVELALVRGNIVDAEMKLVNICRNTSRHCLIATRVADSVAEGSGSLDDHELYRLYLEVASGAPLTLVLSNETADPTRAVRNYTIVLETLKALSSFVALENARAV